MPLCVPPDLSLKSEYRLCTASHGTTPFRKQQQLARERDAIVDHLQAPLICSYTCDASDVARRNTLNGSLFDTQNYGAVLSPAVLCIYLFSIRKEPLKMIFSSIFNLFSSKFETWFFTIETVPISNLKRCPFQIWKSISIVNRQQFQFKLELLIGPVSMPKN